MSPRPRTFALAAGIVAAVTSMSASPATAAPSTVRVSESAAGVQGNRSSAEASFSADGRFVAFSSHSTNLVTGDTNRRMDIFVRDLLTGTNARANLGPGGVQADRPSNQPDISANGRFVAFSSFATNLVPGDTNGQPDVFLRDMVTGVTQLVSVGLGGAPANGDNAAPAVSSTGRFVAFLSGASNLVGGDTNGTGDVFVRDMQNGVTRRVSVATGGGQADTFSDAPDISGDGRYVVFASPASNLVPGDTNGFVDVFVRDRFTATTQRISVGPGGLEADGPVSQPAISVDGTHAAFMSEATNLVATDTEADPDVLVRDLVTGVNTRVSRRTDFLPGSFSNDPAINGDGNLVAFITSSSLVPADTNSQPDVYLRDVAAGRDILISIGSGGVADLASAGPAISAQGLRVAFTSDATNLVPGDTNLFSDVFVRFR
jgi:Tol biopolymer transport system component